MKKINLLSKYSLILSLILISYGYVCRIANIYFFWESKSIGWVLLFISFLIILFQLIKNKKNINKKAILEKVASGIVILVLAVKAILMITVPFSDAYATAKKYLKNNQVLSSEIGNINSFSLIPLGGIQKSTDSNGESGYATINLTVKGDLKFKDLTIYISKAPDSNEWLVDSLE
ncbi:MAG: hypothetical protein IM600_10125 [Bacteroidetes bacterium]|nr:hypothetical protein [Bacteroidota bacterium]MCA6443772.1 hypothetical protein [Bacteroidota bacterium]